MNGGKIRELSLDGDWNLYLAENSVFQSVPGEPRNEREVRSRGYLCVPAKVPGNYEIDLMRAGLMKDLFFGENVLEAQKYENRHLWYCRRFTANPKPGGRYSLLFEGIDTFASIYLNGELLGEADNMLISHEFPTSLLRRGENEIVVHIRPAMIEARRSGIGAGAVQHQPYNAQSLTVRKAPHMYGWDIMPRILSGGIWKSVSVLSEKEECLDEVYLYAAEVTREHATVLLYYQLKIDGDFVQDYSIRVNGRCGECSFGGERKLWSTTGYLSLQVEHPVLWWVKDMGSPNLYDVTVELFFKGKPLDTWETTLGIRTIRLERTSIIDKNGNGEFCFYLNDERLFVRGTNWVPLDALHSRDRERLPKALALLDDVGCNMVRCWGGNLYESDEFFDFCDRRGIAVWQDFVMGCAAYPQLEKLCGDLRAEATQVVKRLRQHPSLFLWAGDNECDASCQWSPVKLDPNANRLTREVLPRVLRQHDPARPYLPSSPYIDETAYQNRGAGLPEDHLWGPRDYYKGEYYTTSKARFASETGYHGCPSPASVRRFISPGALWPWKGNREWLVHAACMDDDCPYAYRIPLMANQVKILFRNVPDRLEDFALASQMSQAEAMKFFLERFRYAKWRRTGIIWWNLLDGWPQFSDAVVDYYFTKKLAYFVLKTSQQPVCLMVREPENGKLTLMGANEHLEARHVTYRVTDLSSPGTPIAGETILAANSAAEISSFAYPGNEAHFFVIEWTSEDKDGRNYYLSGKPPYDYPQIAAFLKQSGFLKTEGF